MHGSLNRMVRARFPADHDGVRMGIQRQVLLCHPNIWVRRPVWILKRKQVKSRFLTDYLIVVIVDSLIIYGECTHMFAMFIIYQGQNSCSNEINDNVCCVTFFRARLYLCVNNVCIFGVTLTYILCWIAWVQRRLWQCACASFYLLVTPATIGFEHWIEIAFPLNKHWFDWLKFLWHHTQVHCI